MRAYIERFNKEAVEIHTTDHMKKYLLEKGLRPNSDFRKAVGIETPNSLAELLHKAQAYIQYEEKEAAYKARDSRNQENSRAKKEESDVPRRDKERRRDDRPRDSHDHKGPAGRFTEYTLLTAPR